MCLKSEAAYEQRMAEYWSGLAMYWRDWAKQCRDENEPSPTSEQRAIVYQGFACAHSRNARVMMGV